MKAFVLPIALLLGVSGTVLAQDAPKFYTETYPAHALQPAMEAQGALNGEEAVLDAKTRELIGLAVAAQIPCSYCSYAHTASARAAGATDDEIREAVALAAQTRHWSTVLNGMQYDLEEFKSEFDEMATPTE
ncbi:carboxymuconolactone decarboxylase family protein [Halomonas maura]|uniref:carboxymuconolactone decarboxylase family protein n=1 Tax=Halomonas maura TaxID=117606 RepID=UPI0025B489AF|nr:carboxymuconolactone decarboxylase family protein [Halomonas maura]MDN3558171.1 carboxymuconolactone decarboxylase family protein [Halomonas maura]